MSSITAAPLRKSPSATSADILLPRLLSALDTWVCAEEQRRFAPQYAKLRRACMRAYARGGISALVSTYEQGMDALRPAHEVFLAAIIQTASRTMAQAFARIRPREFAAARFDPPASLGLAIDVDSVTMGLSRSVVQRLQNQPDAWGLTYSQRIWQQGAATQQELRRDLTRFIREHGDVQEMAQQLRRFQVDDAALPRHLQRLERAARQALSRAPEAKQAFLQEMERAKRYVQGLTPGKLTTRGFQRTVVQRLNKAVQSGEAAGIDEALGYFLERRARYRGLVLARSTANRAFQETALTVYQQYDFVEAVQWRTSGAHSHHDECNLKAKVDIGLGPGVYYKSGVPWPDHPNGRCYLHPIFFDEGRTKEVKPPLPSDAPRYDALLGQLRGDLGRQANTIGRTATPAEAEAAIARLAQGVEAIPPVYPPVRRVALPTPPSVPRPPRQRVVRPQTTPMERLRQQAARGVDTEQEAIALGKVAVEEMERRGMPMAQAWKRLDELDGIIKRVDDQKMKLVRQTRDVENIREQSRLLDEIGPLQRQIDEMYAEKNRLEHSLLTGELARDLQQFLAEVRPMGGIHAIQRGGTGITEVRDALQHTLQFYPSAWVQASATAAKARPLLGKQVRRGYYWHSNRTGKAEIALSGADALSRRHTASHEWAHRFENTIPGITDLERQFHSRRTAGEPVVRIGFGGANERGRKDQYVNEYMGREYGGVAFEILSVGMESLVYGTQPVWRDREYVHFVLGVLLGVP